MDHSWRVTGIAIRRALESSVESYGSTANIDAAHALASIDGWRSFDDFLAALTSPEPYGDLGGPPYVVSFVLYSIGSSKVQKALKRATGRDRDGWLAFEKAAAAAHPNRIAKNRAGHGSDVFGRNETIVQFDDGPGFAKAIASGEYEDATDEKIAEIRLVSGPRAQAFMKASPKRLPEEADGPIILALEAAPLPMGYISNGLLYSHAIDRLPARTKARLYRLLKGGHMRVVRTWRPTPQYWLIWSSFQRPESLRSVGPREA